MTNINYNYNKLEKFFSKKFNDLEIFKYKIIYIYSDLRYFAQMIGENLDKNKFCNSIVNPLIKNGITIIIPTFTYTKEGNFYVENTPTRLGTLNSWVLKQKNHNRSEHPIFSFASIGPESKIVTNCGKSAFGKNSIHERLKNKKSAFLNIGRPLDAGNTIIHNIEQIYKIKYRFEKKFHTRVFKNKEFFGTDYSAFVRRNDVKNNDFSFDFTESAKLIYDHGIVKETGKPKMLSNISLYDYNLTFEILSEALSINKNIFLKKPYFGDE